MSADKILCSGDSTYFSIKGDYATAYRWQVNNGAGWTMISNGGIYDGATSDSLKLKGVSITNDNSRYRCIIYNSCGDSLISDSAKLKVNPTVTPVVDVTVYSTGVNSFTFEALPQNEGSTPAYQWYRNGVAIPGATNVTYVANSLTTTDMISVELTSSEQCASPATVMSRNITTHTSGLNLSTDLVTIYPNPNDRNFKVKGRIGDGDGAADIQVRNVIGQTVFNGTLKVRNGEFDEQFALAKGIQPGTYIMVITLNSESAHIRFNIAE